MTEYTKGQRVRVLRDSTSSHIEPGTIVTLLDQNTDEFWYKERYGTCWFTNDTSRFQIGAVVSENDIEPLEEPEGYEEVDVDRPEVGDIVTFTYLPMDEVVTTTVHESDFGLEMMGWIFFEDDTFGAFDDYIKVTRVLRKVVPEPESKTEEPPVGSIVWFANGVYAYRVRRGYTDEFPADHDWRTLYSDGSTGLNTWENTKRYSGDEGEFEVVREGGQVEDFQDLE